MRILGTVAEAVEFRLRTGRPLVLVPTMGALHAGHAALIDAARIRAGKDGTVVVSIFVNPAQFGPNEDFAKYPRTREADLELCGVHGADIVFTPSASEMYLPDDSTFVDETALSTGLCGAARPGHFRGVCTVVARLFNIIRPDAAVFGEKDYQQLAVIRRMARDLFFGIEILAHPTVREPDGLALSSRNRYLDPAGRERARQFPAALKEAAKHVKHFLSVEMSMGQMMTDIELAVRCTRPVTLVSRVGGVIPTPEEVLAAIERAAEEAAV